jgi:hypothetical protein
MIAQNNPRPARRGGDMERRIGLGLVVLTVLLNGKLNATEPDFWQIHCD